MVLAELIDERPANLTQCARFLALRDFMMIWKVIVNRDACNDAVFKVCCERCYLAWGNDGDDRRRLVANWVACQDACRSNQSKRALRFAKKCLSIVRMHEDQAILMWMAAHAMWQSYKNNFTHERCLFWKSESARFGLMAGIYKRSQQ